MKVGAMEACARWLCQHLIQCVSQDAAPATDRMVCKLADKPLTHRGPFWARFAEFPLRINA